MQEITSEAGSIRRQAWGSSPGYPIKKNLHNMPMSLSVAYGIRLTAVEACPTVFMACDLSHDRLVRALHVCVNKNTLQELKVSGRLGSIVAVMP